MKGIGPTVTAGAEAEQLTELVPGRGDPINSDEEQRRCLAWHFPRRSMGCRGGQWGGIYGLLVGVLAN